MNGVEIEKEKLSLYTIHSNNNKIIHFFESNQILINDGTIEKNLESIKCHHKQIT